MATEREHKVIGVVLDLPEMCFPTRGDARAKAWQEMERGYWDLPKSPYAWTEWHDDAAGGQVLVAELDDGQQVTLARVWPTYPREIETLPPSPRPPMWDEVCKFAGVHNTSINGGVLPSD